MAETKINTEEIHSKIKELVPAYMMIFLDPKDGISSSEANHIAEKGKEMVKMNDSKINNALPSNDTIHFSEDKPISLRKTDAVDFVKLGLSNGNIYGLSAWLREGIKAKDSGLALLKTKDIGEFSKITSLTSLQIPLKKDVKLQTFTDSDAKAHLGIKEYAEYLKLNSECAELGKLIHNNGYLTQIKEKVQLNKTTYFHALKDGVGEKDYPVECKFVYTVDEITKQFTDVLNLHREKENKLNWYRSKIQNLMVQENARLERDFRKALAEANIEFDTLNQKYMQERNVQMDLMAKETSIAREVRYQCVSLLASYKIVIPDDLQEVYKTISSF